MRFCDECDKLAQYYCKDTVVALNIVVETYSCIEHKCSLCKKIESIS